MCELISFQLPSKCDDASKTRTMFFKGSLSLLGHLLFVAPWITISSGTVSPEDDSGTLVQINIVSD